MHRTLRLWAATFVTMGASYAFTGWNREQAPVLLIIGLLLAVVILVRAGAMTSCAMTAEAAPEPDTWPW